MPRAGITLNYVNFLISAEQAIMGHLYQFTSLAGDNDYFTDLDWDVVYNNQTWKSGSLRIDGLRRKVSIGTNVDEQEVVISALPSDTIFGAQFLTAVEARILDGCQITRYRAVWAFDTGNLLYDLINTTPLQVWTMFTGYVSEISAGGMTSVSLKVKSPLVKLQVNMPRNYYQPGCLYTLFDSGCTLVKSSFAVNATIGSGATGRIIPISGGIATPTGADGIANYAQGRILFTSGANDGIYTLIDTNDSSNLYLAYPLEVAPSAGDTITFYPGCSKSFNTCKVKYNNDVHFRGFDKVPPVSISI